MKLIRANVRVPEMVVGDLNAQITAQTLCRNRVVEFMEEYALEDLTDLSRTIQQKNRSHHASGHPGNSGRKKEIGWFQKGMGFSQNWSGGS